MMQTLQCPSQQYMYNVFFCLFFRRTAVKKAVDWINENLTPASQVYKKSVKNWRPPNPPGWSLLQQYSYGTWKIRFQCGGTKSTWNSCFLRLREPKSESKKPYTRTWIGAYNMLWSVCWCHTSKYWGGGVEAWNSKGRYSTTPHSRLLPTSTIP